MIKRDILEDYLSKSGRFYVPTYLLKDLKRELVANLHTLDDGYLVAYFYRGYNYFTDYINRLYARKLADLDISTVKIMNYIDKINKSDLDFMMKEL